MVAVPLRFIIAPPSSVATLFLNTFAPESVKVPLLYIAPPMYAVFPSAALSPPKVESEMVIFEPAAL